MKYVRLLIFTALVSICVGVSAQVKREFRGAWIQTVHQSEYSRMSIDEMKADFIRKLNLLQKCGFNAIIFQIRPEADAWYPSELEPWSRFCTGVQGKAPEPFSTPQLFLSKSVTKEIWNSMPG